MSVDRRLWRASFKRKYTPAWPCPACRVGKLRLVPESMTVSETETSRRTSRDHPDYEGRFSCTLRCSNLPCVEPVAVVGNVYSDEQVDDGEGGWEWEEYMVPVFVHPVPDLFSVVPQCPKDIATEIRRAFSLFWCDLRASANRIRAALELILDHFRIPRRHKVKGGLRQLS